MHTSSGRDITVDIARSLAIVTMIAANLAPLMPQPHHMLFRLVSSFAAPLFITLAGMMVARAVITQGPAAQFTYFLKRGLFLIAIAIFIDMAVLGEFPFSMDVLFLIGVGLPLAHWGAQQTLSTNAIMAVLMVGIGVALRAFFGYIHEPFLIELGEPIVLNSEAYLRLIRMWFIEGWFPVFPWLGYVFFGVCLGKIRWAGTERKSFCNSIVLTVGLGLGAIGYMWMHFGHITYLERDGYAEIFYPATIEFIMLSASIILLIFYGVDKTVQWPAWRFIMPFGEASMFVYISHLAIIEVLSWYVHNITYQQYAVIYGGMTALMLVCCRYLRVIKGSYRTMPTMMKWVLGS